MQLFSDNLIIVTGGAGFIGSCMVRYLNDLGLDNVIIVDDFRSTEKWKNLIGKRFKRIISRYELFDFLKGKQSDVELIIHMGACSDTTETDADYIMDTNYYYSIELAEYALANKIRFVYASSAATYGGGELGYEDDLTQMNALRPLNMYGYSKLLFDQWLISEDAVNDVLGFKFFNVFGPNEYHKKRMASVMLHFTRSAMEKGSVSLFQSHRDDYEHGKQMRDFIYVKDVVSVMHKAIVCDVKGIYNLGTGRAHTFLDVAEAVHKALGIAPKIEFIEMPEDLREKYQYFTEAPMNRLQAALSQKGEQFSFTPLEESIQDYVQNYIVSEQRW